jgi:hypothetical protein
VVARVTAEAQLISPPHLTQPSRGQEIDLLRKKEARRALVNKIKSSSLPHPSVKSATITTARDPVAPEATAAEMFTLIQEVTTIKVVVEVISNHLAVTKSDYCLKLTFILHYTTL